MRFLRAVCILFLGLGLAATTCSRGRAQGALLLQDADSLAAIFSPLGHQSMYFARICAASLTQLRRCAPGELGVVIARHSGMANYDWLALPVIPYLYSVEDASAVPARVDGEAVQRLRMTYHDAHLMSLGNVRESGHFKRGWDQLVGVAYERRIYAFRFETTPAEDDAFIARMNAAANRSHFSILFRNCADFSSNILSYYFPGAFRRHIAPDGGLVTPRQVAYELVRYARKHPEIRLTVLEIPLVPGFHHRSRLGKTAVESLLVTGYVIPIGLLSPYAAGVIVADYLVWGRDPLPVKQAEVLTPGTMALLGEGTGAAGTGEGGQGPGVVGP
jgi:hypothetical protein